MNSIHCNQIADSISGLFRLLIGTPCTIAISPEAAHELCFNEDFIRLTKENKFLFDPNSTCQVFGIPSSIGKINIEVDDRTIEYENGYRLEWEMKKNSVIINFKE